jgi:hypothetical protein
MKSSGEEDGDVSIYLSTGVPILLSAIVLTSEVYLID